MIHKIGFPLLVFFLVVGFALKGIAKPGNSFVGFNAGLALPFAQYRATTLDGGSFALNGFSFYAEGAWFFHPKVGVGAAAGFNLNPVDVSSLGWEKVQADPFLQDVTIRSDPYLTVTAMGGGYTKLPLWKEIFFTGKVLAGLLYGETPYQLYKPEYFLAGPPYYEITSAKDWKFSWQAGAGIRYDVSSCIGLALETVILYDRLSFDFRTANGIRTDVHTIALFSTTLGVRIRL